MCRNSSFDIMMSVIAEIANLPITVQNSHQRSKH